LVKHAVDLAKKLKADIEVVALGAWLHDIGSIIHGRENHHITGAKIAGEKLRELGCPEEKIKHVQKCILNHRGSQDMPRLSIEEQIVAEADVMSNFDNISGLFNAALCYEGKTQEEAKISVREKLQRKWKQLHFEDSKKLMKEKYDALMLVLK
jgi:uncharacterized protein